MKKTTWTLLVTVGIWALGCGGDETPEPICTPGEMRCNGDQIEICSGLAWEPGNNCAAAGKICQMNADGIAECVSVACVEDETRCSGDLLQTCADGAWTTSQDCAASNMICHETALGAECALPPCEEGQQRCSGNAVQVCTDGLWELEEDCTASGATCVLDEQSGEASCVACTDGERRCDGDELQYCDQGSWIDEMDCTFGHEVCVELGEGEAACRHCRPMQTRCRGSAIEICNPEGYWQDVGDCAYTFQACSIDPETGNATCTGLVWEHIAIEIDDPIMQGSSLQLPIDGPSFAYDPDRDLFCTQYQRDVIEPEHAYVWFVDPAAGSHYRTEPGGDVFDAGENFCMNEDWCQMIGFDPASRDLVIAAPSASVLMRLDPDDVSTIVATSGPRQPNAYIDRAHVFDWTQRQLLLYGAIGPSEFSHAVYRLDLDTGAWSQAVTGLHQVTGNCLVFDASADILYSFGGRETQDGGDTSTVLATYDAIDLNAGTAATVDLPAGIGPRRAMSCALDPTRGLAFVFGGSVVHDRFDEIDNEYHNDLWAMELSSGSWTQLMQDVTAGIFEVDSYGDHRLVADLRRPNFGQHRGKMDYDPGTDRLFAAGEMPVFTHGQLYALELDGVETLLP
ncbi:MAG: hypothetical protein JXR96_10390 [Deltaproteobacteria bacterium]|nr:hypothetical protein [Deltaproteobacteria bacterium]